MTFEGVGGVAAVQSLGPILLGFVAFGVVLLVMYRRGRLKL